MAEGFSNIVSGEESDSDISEGCRKVIRTNAKVTRPPTCRFYKRGYCSYGVRCRFYHPGNNQQPYCNSDAQQSTSGTNPFAISETMISNNKSNVTKKLNTERTKQCTNPLNLQSSSGSVKEHYETLKKWVDAPEFIPSSANKFKGKSYAEVVTSASFEEDMNSAEQKLCPYAEFHGRCVYAEGRCHFLHGDVCDLCGHAVLHPFDEEKRKLHTQECVKQHEKDMELSFAVARSKEKSCGVCFEVIMEKAVREQRFGILPNCNHCFCLSCIRKWRQAKQFDNKIIRACPECRVTSDFVCPSMYWVDTKEEKDKLINDYKVALSQKNCKYFKQGRGKCPFGNKCFYLHALPDGTKTDVGPPPRQPRRQAHDGDIDVLQQIILWDFFDDRENRWLYSIADDLEDLVAFFSDSDDSDWSEYDFFFD